MKEFMVDEKIERLKLIEDLEGMEKKVASYQEQDQMVISKKVQKELKKFLEASAQDVIQIQKEKEDMEMRLQEHKYLAA